MTSLGSETDITVSLTPTPTKVPTNMPCANESTGRIPGQQRRLNYLARWSFYQTLAYRLASGVFGIKR